MIQLPSGSPPKGLPRFTLPMKTTILALFVLLLVGCSSNNPGPDPVTGNPASETPAEYRERISKSSLSPEEKQKKLDELDRVQSINQQMLKNGPPKNPYVKPQ